VPKAVRTILTRLFASQAGAAGKKPTSHQGACHTLQHGMCRRTSQAPRQSAHEPSRHMARCGTMACACDTQVVISRPGMRHAARTGTCSTVTRPLLPLVLSAAFSLPPRCRPACRGTCAAPEHPPHKKNSRTCTVLPKTPTISQRSSANISRLWRNKKKKKRQPSERFSYFSF
jgi:hypothetical protein